MLRPLALLLALVAGTAASPAPEAGPSAPPTPRSGPEARAHWPVTAPDAKVQDLVDRGVAMLYAFDTGEARVAFAAASQRAPDLVLPYAGEALAETIDINLPSTPEGEKRGAAAIAKAHEHLAHATEADRALIEALAKRFGTGTQKQRFARYADAMSAYTKTHRDDANVLTLAAFAIFEAHEDVVDDKDAMTAQAREALGDLDRALVLDPQNLGAHHLRIHLLEDARRAREAIPDAEALASYRYPLGMSHLPHMAGHVWTRIGDYDKLIADNLVAIENDRGWFAAGNGPGQQYMKRYHDHDVDFALYGMTTIGRDADARALAKSEDTYAQVTVALRLHDDAQMPSIATGGGAWSVYARALAAARSGDAKTAFSERNKLVALAKDDASFAHTAEGLVDAALARRANDSAAAIAAYKKQYDATKSDIGGDPKDFWPTPIGEGYGAALLAAGKAAEAEAVFTAELKRFPADPHLEWGLAEAQKAQHEDDAAARAAYRAHWKGTRTLTVADLG